MLASEGTQANTNDLTDNRFDIMTHKLIKFHTDRDIWMIPLMLLVCPYFIIYNSIYCETNVNSIHTVGRTVYVVEPMRK